MELLPTFFIVIVVIIIVTSLIIPSGLGAILLDEGLEERFFLSRVLCQKLLDA